MRPVVFVSHAIEDRDDVSALVQAMQNSLPGVDFFVSSESSIAFGDDWRAEIEKNLRQATALLVVLSYRAIDRPWIHFEAGFAQARGIRTFVALIDACDPAHIPATLSALQAAVVPDDFRRLVRELALHFGIRSRRAITAVDRAAHGATPLGPPGIYVGKARFDHANGWVRYEGSSEMTITRRWIDPGASFDNAFRFPPEDTLKASCDVVAIRLLPVERVDLYVVAKLTSDRVVKLYLSTSHLSWGFTGDPSDEFRIPLRVQPNKWHFVKVDLRTFATPLHAPIKRVIGFKLRGGSRVSHILCGRPKATTQSSRDIEVSLAYPA